MVANDVLERLQKAREKKAPKAQKPLKRVAPGTAAKKAEDVKLFAADKEFYAMLWANSPHKCQQCGMNLGKEPLTLFFHHLLPKARYPDFRHTPENIMILCRDDHSQAETDVDKVPKVRARRDEVAKMLLNTSK